MPVLEIYGDIGENYWEPEAGITGKSVSAWLKANAEGAQEITVLLNSYGGAVSDGVAIHNLLSQHPARVIARVMGFALSAASVIAMAGDEIEMLPGTMLMVHPASGMAWGTAEDMESTAKALRSMSDASAQIYADRTGKSKEECLALMDAETWMQPSEALSLGFCDKVISGKSKPASKGSARASQRWTQSYKHAPESFRQHLAELAANTPFAEAHRQPPRAERLAAKPSNHFRAVQSPLGELASSAKRARLGDL